PVRGRLQRRRPAGPGRFRVHADGRRLERAAGRVHLVAAGAGEVREGVRRRRGRTSWGATPRRAAEVAAHWRRRLAEVPGASVKATNGTRHESTHGDASGPPHEEQEHSDAAFAPGGG